MSQIPSPSSKTKPPTLRGIILDVVHPSDFLYVPFTYCCEQCSFYCEPDQSCSMGHVTKPHRRDQQLKTYELTGRMAFCRNLEID